MKYVFVLAMLFAVNVQAFEMTEVSGRYYSGLKTIENGYTVIVGTVEENDKLEVEGVHVNCNKQTAKILHEDKDVEVKLTSLAIDAYLVLNSFCHMEVNP